ncbi:MAG: AraC family transcriptional regulator [Pseudomonadales bacterium]|nr:AraC family transcriptional regulator [Pseudomonadales bacterium]MCP5170933.1 AraC family transcriptional regulator [Pseudomonadales bacterium]MCP5301827.1 AraC family transcriptional regulator [Pseudomonadales bacterium]
MATISLHHVNASLEGCRQHGINDLALLARAGINPTAITQNTGRIHTDQVGRLFRLIQQELNDEFMGFTRSRCKFGVFSTLCDLLSHCQVLGEVLRKAIDLYNLLTDDLTISLEISGNSAELSLVLTEPTLDHQHFLAEFLLVIWHRFPSWYIGEAIRLRETHFSHPPPAHRNELRIMFPGPLHFNQSSNRLVFDVGYLQKPLLRTAKEREVFLANYPVDIMTIPGADGSLEAQVERAIVASNTRRLEFLKAEQLADKMGIGKLSLYRGLQKEGTGFQRIKDNIRREVAIELLTQHDRSIDQISEIVGFSEPRSFTRAFRQWTGLSPRQYRTSHLNSNG